MREAKLSILERLERAGAQSVLRLPETAKILLSGRPRVVVDGLVLDPDMQLLLALRSLVRSDSLSGGLAPAAARAQLHREALVHRGNPTRVGHVHERLVDGAAGPLEARHYVPDEQGQRPLLVFFHGGGFVVGDLDTHDEACRILCRHAGVHVLSVAYRLAPEAPFPAAVDDARAAFLWAQNNASDLGADPSCVGLGGDSAGGNLAAVVSQMLVHENAKPPAMQLLIYPSVDQIKEWPSYSLFAEGYFLSRADLDYYIETYAAGSDVGDVRVSPLRAESFVRFPAALVVTAGFDPLRDEGEAYAAALANAGCTVVCRRMSGLVHGFINMTGVSSACREALVEIAGATRAMLASAS
ncbi:MAG: alpha/beta hydrolase [Polyangiaceae bacterium]|nr:alpha/beta hydrolase [Polyangiaceae bacterium]